MTEGQNIIRPSRRSVARGASWAVPALFFGSVAPAVALSPVSCGSATLSGATWTVSKSSATNTAPTTVSGGTITMYTDSTQQSGTTPASVIVSTTVNLVAGVTYSFTIATSTNKGYEASGTCTTYAASYDLQVNGTSVSRATTVTGFGGGTVVTPPTQCTTNGTRNPAKGPVVNIIGSYTATATGPATIRFVFTLQNGTNSGSNDDFTVTPSITTCSR